MPRSIDAPTPIAASDTDTDKHSNAWYDHEETETVSHTCVSSGSDGSHDKVEKMPLSRGRAIALVITLTGAAFINVRRASMIAPRLEIQQARFFFLLDHASLCLPWKELV
jgi:hypothetical protein